MLQVLLAGFIGIVSGAEVVIALRKTEPGLIDNGNLFARVFEILLLAVGKERGHVDHLVMREQGGQFLFAAQRRDAVEFWLQRLQPLGVDRIFIHATGVVIADLLFVRRVLRALLRHLIEQTAQNVLRIVVDDGERAVPPLVRWNRVELAEVSARVLVKVHARVCAQVHHLLVETRQKLDLLGSAACRGVRGLGMSSGDQRREGDCAQQSEECNATKLIHSMAPNIQSLSVIAGGGTQPEKPYDAGRGKGSRKRT